MIACCDTSFLFSLYGNDVHSPAAIAGLTRLSQPVTISGLNDFELTNALHYAEWRKLLQPGESALRLEDFAHDLVAGIFSVAPCDFALVTAEARRLSTRWTREEGHRAFDILHVAVALHLRADLFLTFDARQKTLATSEGLLVGPE